MWFLLKCNLQRNFLLTRKNTYRVRKTFFVRLGFQEYRRKSGVAIFDLEGQLKLRLQSVPLMQIIQNMQRFIVLKVPLK